MLLNTRLGLNDDINAKNLLLLNAEESLGVYPLVWPNALAFLEKIAANDFVGEIKSFFSGQAEEVFLSRVQELVNMKKDLNCELRQHVAKLEESGGQILVNREFRDAAIPIFEKLVAFEESKVLLFFDFWVYFFRDIFKKGFIDFNKRMQEEIDGTRKTLSAFKHAIRFE